MAEGLAGPRPEEPARLDALRNERQPGGFRSSQRFALLLTFPKGWDYRNASSRRRWAGFMRCEVAAGVNPAAKATRYMNATLGGL